MNNPFPLSLRNRLLQEAMAMSTQDDDLIWGTNKTKRMKKRMKMLRSRGRLR